MSHPVTTVVSVRGKKRAELIADPDFSYVGRAVRWTEWTQTKWGNPFRPGVVIVGGHSDYRAWLLDQPQLLSQLDELRGKRLGCWCGFWEPGQADFGCHAIVLAKLVNAQDRAPMKAITIQQPWAHLVIHGFLDPRTGVINRKNIENRTWRTPYQGPLLIHAGQGRDYLHCLSDFPGLHERDLSFGTAIGIVEMFGCIRHKHVKDIYWAEGPWCHQYRNARAFPSTIPWKGALGLWDVPRELMLAIQAIGSIDLADFTKPMRRLSSV